jgi:D-alanyl-D-alanine carboxypeptidase/D-alanyl-D-alanine-endopeptidase (penicillin-binding protein 4)
VAGRSGTLALRLADTPLDGKLRAKTGSLAGVSGLAGFLDGRRPLSFAFLANGNLSESAGRLLQDRLVALLAGYPGPQPRL